MSYILKKIFSLFLKGVDRIIGLQADDWQESLLIFVYNDKNLYKIGVSLCAFCNILLLYDIFMEWEILSYLVFIASIFNAYHFFRRTKIYYLPDFKSKKPQPFLEQVPFSPVLNDTRTDRIHDSVITQMKMWDPFPINTMFFSFCSPVQVGFVILAHSSEGVWFLLHLAFSVVTASMVAYLVNSFTEREKCFKLLFERSYSEYDRFARSHMSLIKFDKGCQTEESSTTHNVSTSTVTYPSLPSPTFDHILSYHNKNSPPPKSFQSQLNNSNISTYTPPSVSSPMDASSSRLKKKKKNPFQRSDE